MSKIDFSILKTAQRLLLEVDLQPVQGTRFQPTGFADLGAARYALADGTEMLLVESAQSVANRLEAAIVEDATGDLIKDLKGLPYIKINISAKNNLLGTTSTLSEAHRLNSGYLWGLTPDANMVTLRTNLFEEFGMSTGNKKAKAKGKEAASPDAPADSAEIAGLLNMPKIARAIFKYDTNTVLHGVFLEKMAGRIRLARAISGFIEARNVRVVESGGVKNDDVDPTGDAKLGLGNVPFRRTEFSAERITAFFNLDLALLRGYGLNDDAMTLLTALALLKVNLFLENGLRLRTACDLAVIGELQVKRPTNFVLPNTSELLAAMPSYIAACKSLFASPAITEVSGTYDKKAKADKNKPSAMDAGVDDTEDTSEDKGN